MQEQFFHRVSRFLGAFRVHKAQKTQDWNAIGEAEMETLRRQCHGYIPSSSDLGRNIKGYIIRSLLHYQLYSLNKFFSKILA